MFVLMNTREMLCFFGVNIKNNIVTQFSHVKPIQSFKGETKYYEKQLQLINTKHMKKHVDSETANL